MTNLEMVAIGLVVIPMIIAFAIVLLRIVDDQCYDYAWYRHLMYGDADRDGTYANEFFSTAFLSLGIANIVIPCIVVYSYLYLSNLSFSEFLSKQTG